MNTLDEVHLSFVKQLEAVFVSTTNQLTNQPTNRPHVAVYAEKSPLSRGRHGCGRSYYSLILGFAIESS
jgi:hypothetical protein